jgi:hypothetical protein
MSEFENPDLHVTIANKVVTDDVAAVEVHVWLNDSEYYIGKGASRRDPSDKVDHETGFKLALGRALRDVGRGILREGNDRVKEADAFSKQQKAASDAARAKKVRPQIPAETPRIKLTSSFWSY